jgi:hypothetical protein
MNIIPSFFEPMCVAKALHTHELGAIMFNKNTKHVP